MGREKAEETAAAIGGFALLPTFAENDLGTDWNDVARAQGPDASRQQFAVALAIAQREQAVRAMVVDHTHGRGHDQTTDLTAVLDRNQAAEIEL